MKKRDLKAKITSLEEDVAELIDSPLSERSMQIKTVYKIKKSLTAAIWQGFVTRASGEGSSSAGISSAFKPDMSCTRLRSAKIML